MRFPRFRKATWALIVWSALTIFWLVAGASGSDCASETSSASQSGCEAGTAIGVLFILFIGFVGFAFLSIVWLVTRPKKRTCPACGETVKKGLMQCQNCDHDFRQVAVRVESTGDGT